jgi:hypothetical protein
MALVSLLLVALVLGGLALLWARYGDWVGATILAVFAVTTLTVAFYE